MAVKLNLLPPELSVSKSLGNLLKTVRILGVIGVAAFLVFAAGLTAFYIFSIFNLNGLNASIATLRAQVSAQENTEQQIVLLKDRLDKASSVLLLKGSYPNLIEVEPFLAALSNTAAINQMVVTSGNLSISINLQENSDVTSLLTSFQSSDVFKSSALTAFSLSPKTGYLIQVDASSK